VVAAIGVSWSSALLIALIEKRVLHAIAIRLRTRSMPGVVREVQTTSLAGSMGRVLGGAVLALGLLVVSGVLAQVDEAAAVLLEPRSLVTILGLLVFATVCTLAGVSLGESPGRDVTAIARRLDALGYNTRHTMAWPVVVTSFDDLGVLFNHLERLRARLAGEVALYQNALDRTRDADAAKAEFLGAVSHELRTPLNSVIGFAQLLLEGTPSPLTEAQAEDVRLIRMGGHQLLALINDILDISMIESGELSLSFSPEDVHDLVREIVGIHQPLVRDKELDLRMDVPQDLPRVVCDRRRIAQVITNLISNAIKFTEQGSVTVRAHEDPMERTVMISVIDTGVGIAEDELDTIFQEYRQVGSLKRRAKGTGLGLAIARTIARHHGGSLSVRSELGKGSAFTLTLPVSPVRRPSKIDMTKERLQAVRGDDAG
jgi:signal transduction histidine kinase